MVRQFVRLGVVALLAVGAVVVPATAAWAPHVPQLQVTPSQMQPGQEVAVYGTRGYGFTNPVEVRFNAADGPVLGSFQPTNEPYAPFGPGTVRIPDGLSPGTYFLWATQVLSPAEKHIRGIPARATITVLGPGGTPVVGAQVSTPGDQGVDGFARSEGPSAWSLVLVGLAVAGVALFGAGLVAVLGSRRGQSGVGSRTAPRTRS